MNQDQEKPPELKQVDEEVLGVDPMEEKAESNTSASSWPHDGQCTLSLSSLRRHRDSKILPQFLHLNS
jgi:hypothetical protein